MEIDVHTPLRCLVAEGRSIFRRGLRVCLETDGDIEVSGEAACGEQAVLMARIQSPDVVVMDLQIPGMPGIEAMRLLLWEAREFRREPPRILALTAFDDETQALDSLRGGARGLLPKMASGERICSAVRLVAKGRVVVDRSFAPRLLERLLDADDSLGAPSAAHSCAGAGDQRIGALSAREREILLRLARGRSNRQLAQDCRLGEATVKSHVSSIMIKLGVQGRVEAVVMAYETGLVVPSGGQDKNRVDCVDRACRRCVAASEATPGAVGGSHLSDRSIGNARRIA